MNDKQRSEKAKQTLGGFEPRVWATFERFKKCGLDDHAAASLTIATVLNMIFEASPNWGRGI